MTVMICYDAFPVRLPDGRGGVHITRKADVGWGEKDPVRDWRNISDVGILLTAEDALALVRAYREDRDGRFEDVSGDGQEVSLEFVPWESYSLYWSKGLKRIEDDLWSDWPDAFMAEVESAAKEAMK